MSRDRAVRQHGGRAAARPGRRGGSGQGGRCAVAWRRPARPNRARTGLDAIRARIGGRTPRPWLLSVAFHAVERLRSWTWRGHWAWPTALRRAALRPAALRPAAVPAALLSAAVLSAARLPADGAGLPRPAWGSAGRAPVSHVRLAAVLGAVAVIVGISIGVQPVRQLIIQASTSVLNGGTAPRASAASAGSGTLAAEQTAGRRVARRPASRARAAHPGRHRVTGGTGSPAARGARPVIARRVRHPHGPPRAARPRQPRRPGPRRTR